MKGIKREKRSFLLIEIVMALVLASAVLTATLYFYASARKTLEEHIVNLQLPAVIDACFLAIEDELKHHQGEFPVNGGERISPIRMYTSTGKYFSPMYSYSAELEAGKKSPSDSPVRLVTVDLEVHLNRGQTITEQRKLCVVVS